MNDKLLTNLISEFDKPDTVVHDPDTGAESSYGYGTDYQTWCELEMARINNKPGRFLVHIEKHGDKIALSR